ncbi:hypothetical protein C8R47DRAFT_1119708 [Mycena vitilis]|nr:hypothetical protein C8R47DRAFT_1119708 [Mycena vitilis]
MTFVSSAVFRNNSPFSSERSVTAVERTLPRSDSLSPANSRIPGSKAVGCSPSTPSKSSCKSRSTSFSCVLSFDTESEPSGSPFITRRGPADRRGSQAVKIWASRIEISVGRPRTLYMSPLEIFNSSGSSPFVLNASSWSITPIPVICRKARFKTNFTTGFPFGEVEGSPLFRDLADSFCANTNVALAFPRKATDFALRVADLRARKKAASFSRSVTRFRYPFETLSAIWGAHNEPLEPKSSRMASMADSPEANIAPAGRRRKRRREWERVAAISESRRDMTTIGVPVCMVVRQYLNRASK